MRQLEELEKKVLQIIQRNKELKNENIKLLEHCKQLEVALATKDKSSEFFENEKNTIKSSIEDLLDSIGSLEEASNKEVTK